MDVRAARTLVTFLASGVRGYWSDQTQDAWTELFMSLEDARCAERAVRMMVNTWTGPNAPSFGQFKQLYDGLVSQHLAGRALPERRETRKALLDYLLGVAARAEDGSRSDQTELENWRRFLRGPLADAIPGTEEANEWLNS